MPETKQPIRKVLRDIATALTPHDLLRLLGIYIAGVAAMFLLLAAVSLIPNDWIAKNVALAQQTIEEESVGHWKPFFAYGQSDKLDIGTDIVTLNSLLMREDQNALQRAVEGEGLVRYWQGYKVWLRPAFLLFTYVDIRTLMMFALCAEVILCMVRTQARFGAHTAVGLGIALAMAHIMVVPWLIEYFQMFCIALAVMAWLLRRYDSRRTTVPFLAGLFLCVGMLAQYVDYLTTPVLTLCLPLSVVLLADVRDPDLPLATRWARLLWPCAAWAFGWLFGWVVKWPLSDLLLQRDTMSLALHQVALRSALGATEVRPSLLRSLARNLFCFLPMNQLHVNGQDALLAVFAAAFAALLLAAAVRLFRSHPARRHWAATAPALFCAMIPYMWFVVVAGHTEEHYVFTYRIQLVTVFLLWDLWRVLITAARPEAGGKGTENDG